LPNERGFFYHFIDIETGERVWNCELSSIDTSLLPCGVLTARQHFNDPEIQDLATAIYAAVGAQRQRFDGNRKAVSCARAGNIIASL